MEDKYYKAYTEILTILEYIPNENLEQIPKDIIKVFEEKRDLEYKFEIDTKKPFGEQELLEETKAILANIFRDYWATPYQKERILEKERYDEAIEKENNIIFESKKNEEKLPVELKKNFYEKIVNYIMRVLNIG